MSAPVEVSRFARAGSRLRISEIFGPTIQGEGPLIGMPTVFVRFWGCEYRCSWCDTPHAVLEEHRGESTIMSPEEILTKVGELTERRSIMVTLSGGNPALQPLSPFITGGLVLGYKFAMETQGSTPRPYFALLDHLILSPKPPSSGMTCSMDDLSECILAADGKPQLALKIVVFDHEDFRFALDIFGRWPHIPAFVQVGTPLPVPGMLVDEADLRRHLMNRWIWLAEQVTSLGQFNIRVLPQLHTLAWGHRRGV